MFNRKIRLTAALVVLTVALSACGDSGTNASEDTPPELPNLEYSQPDVSYFQNNSVKAKSASPNYLAAQSIVLGFSGLNNIGQLYGGFISSAPSGEASFNDGVWEWTYSYSYAGASSEMRLTAEESGDATSWSLFWSFNDGQGNSVENYNLMNGTVQNDGLSGDWTWNSLDPETNTPIPVLTSSWIADGESEHTVDVEVFGEDSGNVESTINFDQSGNDFMMVVNNAGTSSDIEIYWNPETGFGYIDEGTNERLCWDSSSTTIEDVDCSEAGF